jgi:peptide/nickel transport system ATP-binding protein
MNLRLRLDGDGIDVAGVREFVAAEEGVAADAVDDGSVAAAIRAEFDVPETLSDARAEAVLRDALAEVVAGETAAASERLSEAFPTVCARERPALEPTGAGHDAACHLHRGYRSAPPAEERREQAPGADE